MKTLIVAPNWIGDAVMAQPLLALLKRAEPRQKIDVLAPAWVGPVLEAMPEVDTVIATKLAHRKFEWRARRELAGQLRAEGYDRAFVLPNSFKSALIPWLAKIPHRVGYVGEIRYGVLNARLAKPRSTLPMARRYAALAPAAGIEVPVDLPAPRLAVDGAQVAAAVAKFGIDRDRELIALCPGAEYGTAKRWPERYFAELAERLLARDPRVQVVLLGGPGDRQIGDAIAAKARAALAISSANAAITGYPSSKAVSGEPFPQISDGAGPPRFDRIRNLAGLTSLDEAIALIAAASSVVSNDSGLMHIAAALQRPQVAIFGSSDPRHTPPLSSKAEVVWLGLACSPCFQRTCPLGHLNCLNQIEPQRVLDLVDRSLGAERVTKPFG